MEGSIFLFCTWCIWIITTFFMDKNNPSRTKYSIYILTAIILSPYRWEWQGISCSILLLIVLIMSFFYTGTLRWKNCIYTIISSFFMMLAYVTYELMAILDPVWVFIPGVWLKTSILFTFLILLHKNIFCQILVLLIGSINGEMVLSFLIRNYQMDYSIGSMAFFDFLTLGLLGLISLYYLKITLARWENYVFLLEKERQKNL
ncbi:hypothetical protein SFC57_03665 [Niallia circulans]|uniref:YphA family membrane protein n=1 Tax=Niallia circulans TaxID=1397 RepID=UPI00156176F1|nr:hypothetical protein [Niallia circulans]NRG32948.1 hypothetical protein [Niallia circulans]